jgi:hypothetical protein
MPAALPSGLADFVDHVLPLLRSRGLYRREYEGTTLRQRYGLARPGNQYLASAAAASAASAASAATASAASAVSAAAATAATGLVEGLRQTSPVMEGSLI